MDEKTEGNDGTGKKNRPWVFSLRGVLALAAALVVILALLIGLNAGGLREWPFGRAGVPRIDSIAILPFENLAKDPAQQYFTDGITGGLRDSLAQIGTFRVIAGSSMSQYRKTPNQPPEVARELNVTAVVEGGVMRSGDSVRISVDLVYAPVNQRLWAQTYERELRDIPRLQAEISRAIAREIRGRITSQQEERLSATRAVNPQAHEAYLRGVYGREPDKAEAYLKQAIQIDPAYAPPYVSLASRYYWSNYFTSLPPRDTYPKAKEAAQKALSLDPTLADAHYYLALVAQEHDWNFVEAEKEFKRALELNPNQAEIRHLYSHFLLSMGRPEESGAEDRLAEEIDPADPGLVACFSWHAVSKGNYDECERVGQQALRMGSEYPRIFLGWSYEQRGRFDEAIPELQKAVVGWGGAVFATAALGHAYASAGKEREAREVLDKLLERSKKEFVSAYEIAAVYDGLGDQNRAFDWLQKAYDERSNALVRLRMDPRLRSLESDKRFGELLGRLNLPQKQ